MKISIHFLDRKCATIFTMLNVNYEQKYCFNRDCPAFAKLISSDLIVQCKDCNSCLLSSENLQNFGSPNFPEPKRWVGRQFQKIKPLGFNTIDISDLDLCVLIEELWLNQKPVAYFSNFDAISSGIEHPKCPSHEIIRNKLRENDQYIEYLAGRRFSVSLNFFLGNPEKLTANT